MPHNFTDQVSPADRAEAAAVVAERVFPHDKNFLAIWREALDALDHHPEEWLPEDNNVAGFYMLQNEGDLDYQDIIPIMKKR